MIPPTNEILIHSDFDHLPLRKGWSPYDAINAADFAPSLPCARPRCGQPTVAGHTFCTACEIADGLRVIDAIHSLPKADTGTDARQAAHGARRRTPRPNRRRKPTRQWFVFARYAFICVPGSLFGGYFLPGVKGVLPTLGILVASLFIIVVTLFLYAICRVWQEDFQNRDTLDTPRETAKRRLLADRARLRPACRARKESHRP